MKMNKRNFTEIVKEHMKNNLIRLFTKENNACYQDIYKQFMLTHCQPER